MTNAGYERLIEIQQSLHLAKPVHYLSWYHHYLQRFENEPIKLLELGIAEGSSLKMWRDFLPKAELTGLDLDPVEIEDAEGRVATYAGEQQDVELLHRIGKERAPGGFDVIIDDASHVGEYSKISFYTLFTHYLRPGGLYFFEDWGTGYWDMYPDGKLTSVPDRSIPLREQILGRISNHPLIQGNESLRKVADKLRQKAVHRKFPSHQHGTVGVLKQIIDECGSRDITDSRRGKGTVDEHMVSSINVRPGLAVIIKADPEQGLFQLPAGA